MSFDHVGQSGLADSFVLQHIAEELQLISIKYIVFFVILWPIQCSSDLIYICLPTVI